MENILTVRNLIKNYPGVEALKGIDLEIEKNTVHCIVGENGAGKSTFIKILTCAEKWTAGEIFFKGQPYNPKTIRDAMDAGISTLFQELNVVDQLTVEENLSLGRENSAFGIIKRERNERITEVLNEFAPDISLNNKVSSLSFAQKQIIEIVKAISVEATLIIMDEPTASLSVQETRRLFEIIKKLKSNGITIIYISHILDDIFTIGERVTVFRDGEVIDTHPVVDIEKTDLIKMMVGKVVIEKYKPRDKRARNVICEVKGLETKKLIDVSFTLSEGEIIGFYGLRGAGKSELSQALYGLDRLESGYIKINNAKKQFVLPQEALNSGIALIPEERMSEGLILKHDIISNITLSNPKKISKFGVTNKKRELDVAKKYIKLMGIKTKSPNQRAGTLSGGNQQKVVISKCINTDSKILIMDEPTRGVDVGAKEEIHNIIRELAGEGVSIIVLSSELPEILNLCDRIYLLWKGQIVKELENKEADQEEIMHIVSRSKRS